MSEPHLESDTYAILGALDEIQMAIAELAADDASKLIAAWPDYGRGIITVARDGTIAVRPFPDPPVSD